MSRLALMPRAEIFEKGILKLDEAETGIMTSRQPIERYQWPLSVAVGFACPLADAE